MKIRGFMIDGNNIFIDIIGDDRECIWQESLTDFPKKNEVPTVDEILEYLNFKKIDITQLPQIENVSPSMCSVYASTVSYDGRNYAVNLPDENEEGDWTYLGLTVNEFIEEIENDIKKYNLENYIKKGINNTLFTCYSGLQKCFSMPI